MLISFLSRVAVIRRPAFRLRPEVSDVPGRSGAYSSGDAAARVLFACGQSQTGGHPLAVTPASWRRIGAVREGTISLIESETSVRWMPGAARMAPAMR